MGHSGSTSAIRQNFTQKMAAQDFIWLATLGCACRHGSDLEEVCSVIDDVAGQLWSPVTDVVAACIEEMLRGATLAPLPNQPGFFVTTDTGRQVLSLLLAQPTGPLGCPLGQVGLRLKLAFMDLVPNSERRQTLIKTIVACQSEIRECERRCLICNSQGAYGQLWLRHEADRLRRDLSLLLEMNGEGPIS